MDFYAVLKRPGYRVAARKHAQGRIGNAHKIGKEDAQAWYFFFFFSLSLLLFFFLIN